MAIETTDILTGEISADVQKGVESLVDSVDQELNTDLEQQNKEELLQSEQDQVEVASLAGEGLKAIVSSFKSESKTLKEAPSVLDMEPVGTPKGVTLPGTPDEAAARATFEAPQTQQVVGTEPRITGLRVDIDKINTDDDFVLILNQLNDAAGREVASVSHQKVLDDMAAEGWSERDLKAILDPNNTLTGKTVTETLAKRAVVLKKFLDDEALLRGQIDAAGGWDNADDQLIKDYMKAQFLLAKAQDSLQGYGSDVGRALSLKNATWDQVQPAVSDLEGRVRRIADDGSYDARVAYLLMGRAKSPRDHAWLSTIASMGKKGRDMLWYNWYNSVLSSVDTSARILAGNTFFTFLRAAERPVAALVGRVRYGAQKLAGVKNPDRPISARELMINLRSIPGAFRDSFVTAGQSFKNERNMIGRQRQEVTKDNRNPFMFGIDESDANLTKTFKSISNTWGLVSSVPNRGIVSLDDAAKAFNMTIEMRGLAARRSDRVYHDAIESGMSQAEAAKLRDNTFNDFIMHPDPKDFDEAKALAERIALSSDIESSFRHLEAFANSTFPINIFSPFIRTSMNGISTTAEYAPFGGLLSQSFRKQLMGHGMAGKTGDGVTDAVNTDQALARFSMGLGIGWMFTDLVSNNFQEDADWGVTGAMMYDPEERKLRMQRGEMPFAVWWNKSKFSDEELASMKDNPRYKFSGDRVYQTYMGMEPASGILASWATIMEYNSRHEDADAADRFTALMAEASAAYMSNMPMLQQLGNFYNAVVFRPNDQSAMDAISQETIKGMSEWTMRGSGALNYDGLMRWMDKFNDPVRYETTSPMEDYANMSPILRDVMDTLYQHQVQNPVWRHYYDEGQTPKIDIMSGEIMTVEGDTGEKLIPGYMRMRRPNEAWKPLWQMKQPAPTVPKHIDQVFLNGPQKQFWANAISNDPVQMWFQNPETKEWESGGLAYDGMNMREKLASLNNDPLYLELIGTGTDKDYEAAQTMVRDIISTAKTHANAMLRNEYKDLHEMILEKETDKIEKRKMFLEQFGDKY